jgi:hypothetical protein
MPGISRRRSSSPTTPTLPSLLVPSGRRSLALARSQSLSLALTRSHSSSLSNVPVRLPSPRSAARSSRLGVFYRPDETGGRGQRPKLRQREAPHGGASPTLGWMIEPLPYMEVEDARQASRAFIRVTRSGPVLPPCPPVFVSPHCRRRPSQSPDELLGKSRLSALPNANDPLAPPRLYAVLAHEFHATLAINNYKTARARTLIEPASRSYSERAFLNRRWKGKSREYYKIMRR